MCVLALKTKCAFGDISHHIRILIGCCSQTGEVKLNPSAELWDCLARSTSYARASVNAHNYS